jgi:hypothetical protein
LADLDKLGVWDCDMNERNNDNFQALDLDVIGDFDDDYLPEDALPLCPKCLTPCPPLQYYCPHCDSNDAINPLTPYIPFLNIRFNYDIFCTMWRKIWSDEHTGMASKVFYLLMIALFVPIFIVMVLPFMFVRKISQCGLRNVTILLFCLIAMILLALFFRLGLVGLR